MCDFSYLVHANTPVFVSPEVKDLLSETSAESRKELRALLVTTEVVPVMFESFAAEIFNGSIDSLRKSYGTRITNHGYTTYRSVLFCLFEDLEIVQSDRNKNGFHFLRC
eukprot:snap_masked-scaffold_30-processed-gene-1.18-mRNA-1 protein AED:0.97 eAED:0.97 QI:0/-1/0/1/-1/1/1/0/108